MDQYQRATQFAPAAAVLAPFSVLAILVIRADDLMSLFRSVIGIVAVTGFHAVLLRLVRDRGNAVERQLWDSWGGVPTTQRLRWRGRDDDTRMARLHHRVQEATGVQLPTRDEEESNPSAADNIYGDAVERLRELTRNHDSFPRVWSELKQYSAARNMYGSKPAGIAVAVAAFVASAVMTVASLVGWWNVTWSFPTAAGVFAVLAGVAWVAIITRSFVRTAAERYCDAIFAASK